MVDGVGPSRRFFLKTAALATIGASVRAQSRPPNIVFIFADDMGYGDVGCYGSNIATPNLDRMARNGARFTHFYAASPVCSPSRAGLLTGRYPVRVNVPRVLDPDDPGGIPASETTMAQMLKKAGYSTMCIGKWHLGSQPGYLPTDKGFDEYYGIPYSHDMWPRPLMYNKDIVEQPATLDNLTSRYTDRALDFIKRSKTGPFFLYMPHNYPHIPLSASGDFAGRSGQGMYGDVVQELDWSVGKVLEGLAESGVQENTLVMFSSDNGPWYQGSPGRLRGRKGDTFEGGMREPFIAQFPGRIPAGLVSSSIATTLDIMPTVARLTGAPVPDNPFDGVDIWPILSGDQPDVPRDAFLYFNDVFLQCARVGQWKLHLSRYNSPMFTPSPPGGRLNLHLPKPELYNVVADPEEAYDRSDRNQAVVADIRARVDRLIQTFPAGIIQTYNDTMKTSVEDTPVAAPPIQKSN